MITQKTKYTLKIPYHRYGSFNIHFDKGTEVTTVEDETENSSYVKTVVFLSELITIELDVRKEDLQEINYSNRMTMH